MSCLHTAIPAPSCCGFLAQPSLHLSTFFFFMFAINRDNAAGFSLNTLATNNQHRTLVVDGKQTLTTHTDYLNKYPSTLQTMCYNFTGMARQESIVHILSSLPRYFPNFLRRFENDIHIASFNLSSQTVYLKVPKTLCGQVDEAGDEGPSHLEVQFWWTRQHVEEKKAVTLVSSCNSGASYLNHVELQNGCLALVHTNLFIPSTSMVCL